MKIELKDIALFDQYLDNTISKQERDSFKVKLTSDKLLQEKFNCYNESRLLIESHGLKEEIGDIIQSNRRKHIPFYYIAVAASLSLLITFTIIFRPGQSHDELFGDYFQPYSNIFTVRSSDRIIKAMEAYNNTDFNLSLKEFNQLNVLSDTLQFYKSQCFLALHMPDSAISIMNGISTGSVFSEQVAWYKALAYLKKNDEVTAKKHLRQISAGQFNHKKALLLINKLE